MTSMSSLFSGDSSHLIKERTRGSAASMGSYLGVLCEEGKRSMDASGETNNRGIRITEAIRKAPVSGSRKEEGDEKSKDSASRTREGSEGKGGKQTSGAIVL